MNQPLTRNMFMEKVILWADENDITEAEASAADAEFWASQV